MHKVAEEISSRTATPNCLGLADRITYVMRTIKATETSRWAAVRKASKASREVGAIMGCNEDNWTDPAKNLQLKNLAVDLARQEIQQDLNEIPEEQGELRSRKKDGVLRKLKKLIPWAALTINAVRDPEAEMQPIHTEPGDIARTLTRHWEKVFSHKDIDENKN